MQTILVCDDDKQIVEAIDIYLTGEGFKVIKAYDGYEALEYLDKNATECPTRHRMVFLHYRQPSTSQKILRLADIRAQAHYGRLDECRTCVLYPE